MNKFVFGLPFFLHVEANRRPFPRQTILRKPLERERERERCEWTSRNADRQTNGSKRQKMKLD